MEQGWEPEREHDREELALVAAMVMPTALVCAEVPTMGMAWHVEDRAAIGMGILMDLWVPEMGAL